MRKRTFPLLVIAGLLAFAVSVPVAQGDGAHPRELQASACSSVKIGDKGHVLYRRGVSCAFSKRWARKLATTGGRTKPRGWKCTSGSKFRSGGYCERRGKHFGWHRG